MVYKYQELLFWRRKRVLVTFSRLAVNKRPAVGFTIAQVTSVGRKIYQFQQLRITRRGHFRRFGLFN